MGHDLYHRPMAWTKEEQDSRDEMQKAMAEAFPFAQPIKYHDVQRENEHLRQQNAELIAALKDCVTGDGAQCLAYGTDTPKLRRRIAAINETVRVILAKVQA